MRMVRTQSRRKTALNASRKDFKVYKDTTRVTEAKNGPLRKSDRAQLQKAPKAFTWGQTGP